MKLKYISILAASSLAISSCGKKFLDKQPLAASVDANYYRTDAELITGINAAYDPLNWYQSEGKSSSTPIFEFIWGDICSDDALGGGDNSGDVRYTQIGNFESSSSSAFLAGVWKNQYIGIRRCNIILEKAPIAPSASAAIKTRVQAEAKFLRAYYHFYLYRMFGTVPYITKQLQNGEFEQAKPSKDEFFTKLVQDLKDAKAGLPDKYSGNDKGRATKAAASGYLARVLMFKGDAWADVLAECKSVIADSNLNGLNLKTPYEKIHSIATEYGSESIFEIGATITGPTATNRDNEGTYYDKITGPRNQLDMAGYGLIAPSNDLVNFFKQDSAKWGKMDPRKKATILAPGDSIYGEVITLPATGASPDQKYYKRKYVENMSLAEQTQGGTNIRLLRTADVYLMAAEAAFNLGQEADAIAYVNAVRKRVKMPILTSAEYSGDKLKTAIWDERRLELSLESLRFFDIVRQGRAGTIFSNLTLDTEGKGFVQGKNEVFPIPQTEIDLSGGKITQNPNYN